MISADKQPAVERALTQALGTASIEDIERLTGAIAAKDVFRIVVSGRPYLLRLIGPNALGDPAVEVATHRLAAEAGLAPRMLYADAAERIVLSEFVPARPFPADTATQLAGIIARLHGLTGFPPPRMKSYLDVGDAFAARFQAANLLPASVTDELFRGIAEVRRVYPRQADEWVASHNDLKPQNYIFDGERFWLVDWEAAFLNDRYHDLTVIANFHVQDEAREAAFLAAYFGRPAGEYERARFFLMGLLGHSFYASCFLLIAASKGVSIDAAAPVPDFRHFHQRILAGEIGVDESDDPAAKAEYGITHVHEAVRKMRSPRFAESLAIVGARHGVPSGA